MACIFHSRVLLCISMPGWQTYGGGIMKGNCGTQLDHGVLAVGYSSGPVAVPRNA